MIFIAKFLGTKSGNVVLIFRGALIRLRAKEGVYEEAIEGEIASCIGRDAGWEIISVCENEKYHDGDACEVEQC